MFTRVLPRLAAATCIGLFASVMRVRVIVLILVLRHPTQNQRISNRKSGVFFMAHFFFSQRKEKLFFYIGGITRLSQKMQRTKSRLLVAIRDVRDMNVLVALQMQVRLVHKILLQHKTVLITMYIAVMDDILTTFNYHYVGGHLAKTDTSLLQTGP